jgi:hypothetical protein
MRPCGRRPVRTGTVHRRSDHVQDDHRLPRRTQRVGCSLTISGEEDEVLRAATAHAIDVHGHTDGEELRAGLRAALAQRSRSSASTTERSCR